MKQFNFLFSLIAATMLLWGVGAKAQPIPVHNEQELVDGVASLKTNGGGTLVLTQPFDNSAGLTQPATTLMLGIATSTAIPFTKIDLSSDAANPITIDCGTYGIQVNGYGGSGTWDGNSSTAANTYILSIGANVTVTGSAATLMTISNRANIEVANGGKVLATGGVAINNSMGRLITRPGSLVEIDSNNGVAVQSPQNFTLLLRGGTIKATGTNAVGIKCNTNPGTANEYNNGLTIIAGGSGAKGIVMATSNLGATFTNATIQTSSPDNTDVAIDNTGTGTMVSAPVNINITSSRIYNGADPNWLGWDRIIAADPDAGIYSDSQNISLTATDDGGAAATEDIYYGINALPSTQYSAAIPITVSGTLNANITVAASATSNLTTIRSFAYEITAAGITVPSIDKVNAYINGNMLYFPESGAVHIYNVSGQLVLSASGASVDISSLNKGVYVVKAGAATFKVVK